MTTKRARTDREDNPGYDARKAKEIFAKKLADDAGGKDLAAMAALPVAQIEAIVRPCGLAPRKAAAIRELSRDRKSVV